MYPILIASSDQHFALWSNQVLLALALLLGWWVGPPWIERLEGIPARRSRYALSALIVAVMVGGRLHFVLNQWSTFDTNPLSALVFWKGGLHAGGAVIALVVAIPLVMRWLALPWGKFADGLVPTAGLCIAVARLGCFLHGCCFGTTCSWPWCISFPRDSQVYNQQGLAGLIGPQALESAPVHPLQLYFVAVGLALTLLGIWMHRRKTYDGEVALVALLLFAASSTALEFLRADHVGRVYWGSWPQLAWTAAALTLTAASALGVAQRFHSRKVRLETARPALQR